MDGKGEEKREKERERQTRRRGEDELGSGMTQHNEQQQLIQRSGVEWSECNVQQIDSTDGEKWQNGCDSDFVTDPAAVPEDSEGF